MSSPEPIHHRDDTVLAQGLGAWAQHRWPGHKWSVTELLRPESGWANETLLINLHASDGRDAGVVIRLPPTIPLYPEYRLDAQARVLEALRSESVPVPALVAFEADDQWLGAEFLAMSREPGRPGPEAPATDPFLLGVPANGQRRMQEGFVQALASIHLIDWRARNLGRVLRGASRSLPSEVAWWKAYIDWATDSDPPTAMADAVAWCAAHAPPVRSPEALCWGDARLGNVLWSDDHRVSCVLDWELASIGPPEMDLAWYLALDDLHHRFSRMRVPGFLPREGVIALYRSNLGRDVDDLGWHEIFALTRSVAISERLARIAARTGLPYRGVAGDANPVLAVLTRRIEGFPE